MNDYKRINFKSKAVFFLCLFIVLLSWSRLNMAATGQSKYDGSKGGIAFIDIDEIVVEDKSRDRKIPIRIYCPETGGPYPVIIYSHGLGGSKRGKVYWSEFLAGHGYVIINLTHYGSDSSLLDPGASPAENIKNLKESLRGGESLKNRPLDVTAVINELDWISKQSDRLKGKFNASRIGVAGHSFGAYTVVITAGAFAKAAVQLYGKPLRDDRPIAFLAMSPSAPRPRRDPVEVFKGLDRPMMTMTGSNDLNPINPGKKAESRLVPYKSMPPGDKYSLWIEGAHHWTFGDGRKNKKPDPEHHKYIKILSLAFWDTYLKGSKEAKVFLKSGAFKEIAGDRATLAFK